MEPAIRGLSLRTLALAAASVAAGIGAGRAVLANRVEAKKKTEIEEAAERARVEIKTHARAYISSSINGFIQRLGVKAIVLGLIAAILISTSAPPGVASLSVFAVLGLFLLWDAVIAMPTVRLAITRLWSAKFSPRRAIGEVVAANVFAEVLRQAHATSLTRTQALLLLAAGTDETRFKTDVAQAVSSIAADTSWDDLRPFLLLAAAKAGAVTALYSAYVWLVYVALN